MAGDYERDVDYGDTNQTAHGGYTGGVYQTNDPPRPACSRNSHYFGCTHERRCYCGMTARLPLEVDEGL